MKRTHALLLTAVLLTTIAPSARAALPSPTNWFKSSGEKKVTVKPKAKPFSVTRPLTKVSDGTKRLVSGTKNAFTPKSAAMRKSGTISVQKAKTIEQPKQGFFKSMFNPDPPPPPKTPSEWMRLKQIHP